MNDRQHLLSGLRSSLALSQTPGDLLVSWLAAVPAWRVRLPSGGFRFPWIIARWVLFASIATTGIAYVLTQIARTAVAG